MRRYLLWLLLVGLVMVLGWGEARSIAARHDRTVVPSAAAPLPVLPAPPLAAAPPSTAPFLKPVAEIRAASPGTAGSDAKAVIDQNRLLVPLGAGGIAVYDLTTPDMPRLITQLPPSRLGGQAGALAVSDSTLYVAIPGHAINVVDITQITQPQVVGSFGSGAVVTHMVVRGTYLYVYEQANGGSSGGVSVYDVRPTIPTVAGTHALASTEAGFFVSEDGLVFLGRAMGTIEVIDMGDPAHPTVVGEATTSGNITDIQMIDGTLYVAAWWGGLWVLDATNPAEMQVRAHFDWQAPEPYARAVGVVPPFVFVGARTSDASTKQLVSFRLDGAQVVPVQALSMEATPYAVYVQDQLLILEGWTPDEKVFRLYEVHMTGHSHYLPAIHH